MLTFLTLAQCRLEVFAFVQELVTCFFSNAFGLEPNLVSAAFAFFQREDSDALSLCLWRVGSLFVWLVGSLVN